MAEAMTQDAIEKALKELPGWRFEDDRLKKDFVFHDFKQALSFIVRIGLHAEQKQHHPELFNVYNKVNIGLNTHDAGGKVTEKDVALAKAIEVGER